LRHLGSLFDVVSFKAPKESCGSSKNLVSVQSDHLESLLGA
jgi:hypothetical protein